MSQHCTACRNPRREEIDRAILEGIPYRTIAARFDLSLGTISRHREHLEHRETEGGTGTGTSSGTTPERSRNKAERYRDDLIEQLKDTIAFQRQQLMAYQLQVAELQKQLSLPASKAAPGSAPEAEVQDKPEAGQELTFFDRLWVLKEAVKDILKTKIF